VRNGEPWCVVYPANHGCNWFGHVIYGATRIFVLDYLVISISLYDSSVSIPLQTPKGLAVVVPGRFERTVFSLKMQLYSGYSGISRFWIPCRVISSARNTSRWPWSRRQEIVIPFLSTLGHLNYISGLPCGYSGRVPITLSFFYNW